MRYTQAHSIQVIFLTMQHQRESQQSILVSRHPNSTMKIIDLSEDYPKMKCNAFNNCFDYSREDYDPFLLSREMKGGKRERKRNTYQIKS